MSESKTPSDYTQFAHAELDKFYEEWPGGLDEVEASVRGWRERAQQFESDLATALAERDSYKTAWEQSDKSCRDLSEKVLPNVRAERDALAARVEKAEASRWQLIETAPQGANGMAWMRLAWGEGEDQCTGDGFRQGDEFFACSWFYQLGQPKQFAARDHLVKPTHWAPLDAPPSDAALSLEEKS